MHARTRGEQMRWWAVFSLAWMVREVIEPARFIVDYPGSWAARLTHLSDVPPLWVVGWFSIATVLVSVLAAGLALAPRNPVTRWAEKAAGIGLAMAAVGYAFLASVARTRAIDAPHVVDTYTVSALLLLGQALLIGCWHNARVVQEFEDSVLPALDDRPLADTLPLRRGTPCDAPGR